MDKDLSASIGKVNPGFSQAFAKNSLSATQSSHAFDLPVNKS